MRTALVLLPAVVLLAAGCVQEKPIRVEDKNLGFVAVFPGETRMHKFSEETPFGEMEWFSTTSKAQSRLDRSFFVNVGNLPPGKEGGSTAPEIMATYRQFLTWRMGKLEVTELPPAKGAGFHFTSRLSNGEHVEGVVILQRGRLHLVQGTVSKSDDPQLKAFLESFEVLP
jgi:hypothetical protein